MKISLLLLQINHQASHRLPVGKHLNRASITLESSVSFPDGKNQTVTAEQPHRISSSDRITVKNEPVDSGAHIILDNKRCSDTGKG